MKTNQGTKNIIYKLEGNDLEFLGTALGEYEISDLARSFQQEQAMITCSGSASVLYFFRRKALRCM
ncbi:MAG: hypothetical protein U5L09_01265 [Bacteroidales bacterium]|nr:hypothetical protein [Bacteroidales bacterium]